MHGNLAELASLERLNRFLDEPAHAEAAAVAIVKLSNALQVQAWEQCEEPLRRIAESSPNEDLRRAARAALARHAAQDP
jgi:hypothetical protein